MLLLLTLKFSEKLFCYSRFKKKKKNKKNTKTPETKSKELCYCFYVMC